MPDRPRDEARERRLRTALAADAYGPEERAAGWYAYLEDTLRFPFRARCVAARADSPLRVGAAVEVVGMAPQEACGREMFVPTPRERRPLAVPLAQLRAGAGPGEAVDEPTRQAVEDWHYWVGRGYPL
jgi:calcium binding protein